MSSTLPSATSMAVNRMVSRRKAGTRICGLPCGCRRNMGQDSFVNDCGLCAFPEDLSTLPVGVRTPTFPQGGTGLFSTGRQVTGVTPNDPSYPAVSQTMEVGGGGV